jgi:thiamine kinase-like enzyme
LTNLERRLSQKNLKLLNMKEIQGAHAGIIYRMGCLDEYDQKTSYIYKEFAPDRKNEIDIYSKIADYIEPFSQLIKVWDSYHPAILMHDLKSPLKKEFESLTTHGKKQMLERILSRLAELHSLQPTQFVVNGLTTHQISTEWLDWCRDQLKRLCSQTQWSSSDWMDTISDSYEKLDLLHYEPTGPLVITHGDPHLENIFYHGRKVWFIDWEWAAIGSPLRDITILLQDIYDTELIHFVSESYQNFLENNEVPIRNEDYRQDFNHLYIDHTTMMLAWEIEKYFQGFSSDEKIQQIIEFKIGEITRITDEELRRGRK